MSDRVIRLGGSHINKPTSIQHLKQFLSAKNERKFVVVSAIPELLNLINESIQNVFVSEPELQNIHQKIRLFYTQNNATAISNDFELLSTQFINLLKGIALIGDYSVALKDQVLSFAEKLSAAILLSKWNKTGTKATLLLPENLALKTTSDFGNATFISIDLSFVSQLNDEIYVVPGSYGMAENGKIARAGKTAADYTAAFLTRELKAEKLELWDLDHNFLRADSLIIKNPAVINRLTYSEASELAYFDHYSFHPRTVEPLEHEHIPIQVINSASSEGQVNTIINTETFVEEQIVKSVAYSDDISLLKLDGPGVGLKPGILAKVTAQLNQEGINIKSVITSQTSINFILNKTTAEKALNLIHNLGFSAVTEVSVIKDISLIGIVGHGMQNAFGVSAKIFNAVANNQINVVLSGSGASDLVSYLVVNKSDKEKSIREIYKAFFSS